MAVSGGEYSGDEGIRISPPVATLERPDYSKQSDADILGIDPDAPDLGDLGPLDEKGKPQQSGEPAQGEKSKTVRLGKDNEILELDDEDKDEEPEEKPKGEESEKPVEDKAKPAEEEKPEEPLTPVKVSEELKSHFEDPKVGKQLKTAFYTAAAYKEIFPDFQQAREIAELFPTAEEARHVAKSYEGFRELQDAYEKNPTEFVQKLHEEGSEEFVGIAEAVFNELPTLQPAAYNKLAKNVVADVLAHCIENTDQIVRESGLSAENLIAAANVIAMNLFGGKDVRQLMDSTVDPKEAEISKLRTELKQEKASKGDSQAQAFLNDVLAEADGQIDRSVDEILTQLLEIEGAQVSKAARRKMGEEIKADVTAAIRENPRIGEAVVDLIRAKGGDFGQGHLKRAADPILKAANLAIRKSAGKRVPEFTREILQIHSERMNKQRQAAQRQDAGSGGGPRVGGAGQVVVTPSMIDYSRTSDDDILEGRVTLKR